MAERDPIQDVNIQLGDDVSKMLYAGSTLTHANRPGLLVEAHQSFSGFRAMPLSQLPDSQNLLINMGFDGVGTKVEASERMRNHFGVAFDLFAMVLDDVPVRGGEAFAIGSILDVRQLDDTEYTRSAVRQLAAGYVAAANAGGVVIVNGEVAELGDRIGGYYNQPSMKEHLLSLLHTRKLAKNDRFNYNWGATALWAVHKDRMLTGHELNAGETLIGLSEPGFRSNGITDVRKAMLEFYGKDWHLKVERSLGSVTLGKLVQQPSTIYSKFMAELTGGYDINREPKANVTGVAHITGGGQPSKIGRMLEPSGLGAVIDTPIAPPAIMTHVQRLRSLSDNASYGKWHMGPGMIFATTEPDKALAYASERGINAQRIGEITDQPGVRIKNMGAEQKEEWLTFNVA